MNEAELENGHIIQGDYALGEYVKTEWGPRRVVGVRYVWPTKMAPEDYAEIDQKVQ